MQKAYSRIYWQNSPSTNTPLGESTLLPMDASINEIDDRVVAFDTTKADQSDLLQSIKAIDYNTSTGVFVFTWWNGTTKTVDLNIEKIPVSFSMDANGVITMTTEDGSTYTADVGSLIKTYTFTDSSEIDFTVTTDASGNKTVTAGIVNGSITGSKLEPNYLANAQAAQAGAELAEDNAEDSATLAQSWAVGGTNTRTGEDTNNAKYWAEQAEVIAHGTAANTSYDDTETGLGDNVQDAIDALNDGLTHTNERADVLGAKNLLPMVLSDIKRINTSGTWSDNVYTNNGINYTVNADSDGNVTSIVADGTASATSDINLYADSSGNYPFEARKYTLTGCPSGGGSTTYKFDVIYTLSGVSNALAIDYGSGATADFSVLASASYVASRVVIYTGAGAVSNLAFYPMIRLSTDTDDTFQPYAKTNLQLTNDVEKKFDCADNGILGAKNLLALSLATIKARNTSGTWSDNVYTYNSIDFTVNTDDDGNVTSIVADGTASATTGFDIIGMTCPRGKYILNGCPDGGGNGKYKLDFYSSTAADFGNGYLFSSDGSFRFDLRITIFSGIIANNLTFYPMVRFATDTDSTFQPYAKTNLQLTNDVASLNTDLAKNPKTLFVSVGASASININLSDYYNVISSDMTLLTVVGIALNNSSVYNKFLLGIKIVTSSSTTHFAVIENTATSTVNVNYSFSFSDDVLTITNSGNWGSQISLLFI